MGSAESMLHYSMVRIPANQAVTGMTVYLGGVGSVGLRGCRIARITTRDP